MTASDTTGPGTTGPAATGVDTTEPEATGRFEHGRYAVAVDPRSHLAEESARFVEVLAATAMDTDVPTCPDWNAGDLLWHLAGVQHFWSRIVAEDITDAAIVDSLVEPDRPGDRDGLVAFFRSASTALATALDDVDSPEGPRWTWAPDQSAAFIARRQVHEALIHRVDAEVAAGTRTPIDPSLAADGIDETLQVMYGGQPAWGSFAADGDRAVLLHATDTGHQWVTALGRFTGTDPADNSEVNEDDIRVSRGSGVAQARIEGGAADLDCWLWHRPAVGPVSTSGDQAVLDRFLAIVAQAIE